MSALINAIQYSSPTVLNYTNPLQGRRWLKYLHEDPVSGLRIEPNLNLPKQRLGFSFSSNSLGLRGPDNITAPNVVLGTSFAMGFTVNNGKNWYDLCLDQTKWCNIGIPIGVRELASLQDKYYTGSKDLALVLYHPNFWQLTGSFEQWHEQGGSLFTTLAWETALGKCLNLYIRKFVRQYRDLKTGKTFVLKTDKGSVHINSTYNFFDFEKNQKIVKLVTSTWRKMLAEYKRIICIRTFLKQDVVPVAHQNDLLKKTLASYEKGWSVFTKNLADRNASFDVTEGFTLDDFQPWDTHWNEQGNKKFAELVKKLLKRSEG